MNDVAQAPHPTRELNRPIFLIAPPRAGSWLLAHRLAPAAGGRVIDPAPRNVPRIGELAAEHPAASFVYVHREPTEVLPLLAQSWRAGDSVTHPHLEGWNGPPWSFLLVPGWRALSGRPLAEIVACQWLATMQMLIAGLEALPPGRWSVIHHGEVVRAESPPLLRLARFLGLSGGIAPPIAAATTPVSVSPEDDFTPFLGAIADTAARARDWLASV